MAEKIGTALGVVLVGSMVGFVLVALVWVQVLMLKAAF